MPPQDHGRRFTIADLSIVIAGLAAALGLARANVWSPSPGALWEFIAHQPEGWSPGLVIELGFGLGVALVPVLAGWTPACLALQIRQPRVRWRRLRRQPGWVACMVATGVLGTTLAATILAPVVMEEWDDKAAHQLASSLGSELAGLGVLTSWVTMRLCGVCRAQPTWTDRLGRLTGAGWIALGVVATIYLGLRLD